MKKEISFLIGLKNNLEYTIFFYENVRKIYPTVEIVFVSYGSKDGTHEWLDQLQDQNLKYFYSDQSRTLSDTYNKATKLSTGEFVCFLHNDMVLGKQFLSNLNDNLVDNAINCYKVIEPPIFAGDGRDWKLNKDFGEDIHSFDYQEFFNFENECISNSKTTTTPTKHTSFFLCIKRQTLIDIGGLDNLFSPMFCEDDDLIIRLKLLGLNTVLVNSAFAYHFVSKTSRFSKEYENKTREIENNSQRNFIRKWGFANNAKSYEKYDIGIVLINGNTEQLSQIETFGSITYVDFSYDDYLDKEQKLTKYDLKNRIKPISQLRKHDVMAYVNGKSLNARTLSSISNLPNSITENKKEFINPNIFLKLLLKIVKPYRPLIFFNKPKRIEKSLINKELEI